MISGKSSGLSQGMWGSEQQ